MLWISAPEMINWIPKSINTFIIYDCMDDVISFPSNKLRINDLLSLEKKLVQSSSLIFFSSSTLQRVIKARYNFETKSFVINNAFSFLNLNLSAAVTVADEFIQTESGLNLPTEATLLVPVIVQALPRAVLCV